MPAGLAGAQVTAELLATQIIDETGAVTLVDCILRGATNDVPLIFDARAFGVRACAIGIGLDVDLSELRALAEHGCYGLTDGFKARVCGSGREGLLGGELKAGRSGGGCALDRPQTRRGELLDAVEPQALDERGIIRGAPRGRAAGCDHALVLSSIDRRRNKQHGEQHEDGYEDEAASAHGHSVGESGAVLQP